MKLTVADYAENGIAKKHFVQIQATYMGMSRRPVQIMHGVVTQRMATQTLVLCSTEVLNRQLTSTMPSGESSRKLTHLQVYMSYDSP